MRWSLLLPLLPSTLGCTYLGSATTFDPSASEPGLVLVRGIEPVRQRVENDCGPAAMTMVLRWVGDPITLDEAVAACPPKPGSGVSADALRGLARSRGWSSYAFTATLEQLEQQVTLGRPVLVGMVKPYIDKLRLHFEVVAGIHPQKRYIVTLDPARGWTRNSYEGFLAEWESAGRPAVITDRKAPAQD